MTTPTVAIKTCKHCGLPAEDSEFCCQGCASAYQLIEELGLQNFYRFREARKSARPAKDTRYRHFDDEVFLSEYVSFTGEVGQVLLYLPGIHCTACVWLLEQLPQIDKGVLEARVSFAESTLEIRYNRRRTSLSRVASLLDRLGYSSQPVLPDALEKERKKETRRFLLRLGVAGFSTANTMILAVSLYQGWFTGMESNLSRLFNWVSLILCLPAVTFCAWPFYRAAVGGLRAKVLHIDLPLSIAMIVAFFLSLVNTLRGVDVVYYDTISMLIFLLLCGRWLQRRGLERAIRSADLLSSHLPLNVLKKTESGVQEVYIGSVRKKDLIVVAPGEIIPVDGQVEAGRSSVISALLTGESDPEPVAPGTPVFAGTQNGEGELEIRVDATRRDTRLGKLTNVIEQAAKDRTGLTSFTDRVSAYFVGGVLVLSILTALYWYFASGMTEAISTSLGLLVVSCPCALGFAAPLAYGIAVRRAATKGILIRGADALERLTEVQKIYFDKTGTLTAGATTVRYEQILVPSLSRDELYRVVGGLEAETKHPVGLALLRESKNFGPPLELERESAASGGVYGRGADRWAIGSVNFMKSVTGSVPEELIAPIVSQGLTPVLLARGAEIVALFGVGDSLREGAKELIQSLGEKGFEMELLSGDRKEIAEKVGALVGIEKVRGELTPEEKARILSEEPLSTIMMGDGANDSAALKSATVGIAVRGGAELAVHVADVYLAEDPVRSFQRLLVGAKRTVGVVRLNLGVSLFYNTIGVLAAVTGYVSPLLAAILMPLSSLSVIGTCLLLPEFDQIEGR